MFCSSYLPLTLNYSAFVCCSWRSSRTMTLVDAPECTAVASPVFQQGNQIFLDRAQWRYIVRSVRNLIIQDPSTKAVSFWSVFFNYFVWYFHASIYIYWPFYAVLFKRFIFWPPFKTIDIYFFCNIIYVFSDLHASSLVNHIEHFPTYYLPPAQLKLFLGK